MTRCALTVWPLDAWAKRLVSKHETEHGAKDMPLWWTSPSLWDRMPPGWTHVGYVEIGAGAERNYDRGALLQHPQGHYCMYTGQTSKPLNSRMVEAALSNLNN